MIDLSLVDNILVKQENDSVNKHVLEIIEDILLRINHDRIDQLKSNIEFNNEVLEINFYSKNNSCCPVLISCEGNNANILIGIGEAIYLDNASIADEKGVSNLKACMEDLFYLPIEELVTLKDEKVLSSSCIINQTINGKVVAVQYKHTHSFSFLPLSKKKVSYKFTSWIEK